MALARFDVDDVADADLALLSLGRGKSFACRDDDNLITVVDMPAGGRADTEVDDVATKIIRLPVADHRLPGPAHRPAGPAGNRCCRVHRRFREFIDFENTHV